MNVLTAAALASLAVLGLLVGRSPLFPPVVFAGIWAGALLALALAGDAFYPIGDATRLVYLLGAAGFALGGFAAHALLSRAGAERGAPRGLAPERVVWVVDAALVLLVVAFPFYWQELQEALRLTAAATVLQAARIRDLQAQEGLVPRLPFLLSNLVQLSIVVTLVAFSVSPRTLWWRVRTALLFLLALTYQVLTGGRAGLVLLVFGVIGIVWMRAGRVRLARVLPALAAFVVVFELIAIQLEKSMVRRDLTVQQNLPALAADFRAYLLGGVVGFNRVVEYPGEIPSTGGVTRTAREMANRLGAGFEIPSLHAQYTTQGDFVNGNVYTAYFQYLPDFGLAGTMFLLALAGAACTAVYGWARRGSAAGLVFYGILFLGMLQSIFIEGFYTNVNLLVKTALVLGVLYATCRPRREAAPAVVP